MPYAGLIDWGDGVMAKVPVVWKSDADALANNKRPILSRSQHDNHVLGHSTPTAADPVHPLAH